LKFSFFSTHRLGGRFDDKFGAIFFNASPLST
jgi:hypothetical protein